MLVLLDAGHGGMIKGQYQTAGKRSPKWQDLPQLFEGEQNRKIVALIKQKLTAKNIRFVDVVDSETDVPLSLRVQQANNIYATNKDAVYLSIHADAHGDGKVGTDANGVSVWTSKGQTKSDPLAESILISLSAALPLHKFRKDSRDGDGDQESDFYVLHKTFCPAVLCELGFMTNRKECAIMLTDQFRNAAAEAIVEGVINYYEKY